LITCNWEAGRCLLSAIAVGTKGARIMLVSATKYNNRVAICRFMGLLQIEKGVRHALF
jgi:hypothetical protein